MKRLSVIIPCWKDAPALRTLLPIADVDEVIVADASLSTECEEIALANGARCIRCDRPSRGRQMNHGAAAATGDVLLFHHADSRLAAAHLEALRHAADNPAFTGGAFHRHFDERHPGLALLDTVTRTIAEAGLLSFYGDQSIWVRRDIFWKLGGFADLPLMEDVEFSSRLRRFGRTALLDPPLQSSARRFTERGAWKTTTQNACIHLLYRAGIPPEWLHRWYYRDRFARAES